jgi:hypothetical protein
VNSRRRSNLIEEGEIQEMDSGKGNIHTLSRIAQQNKSDILQSKLAREQRDSSNNIQF